MDAMLAYQGKTMMTRLQQEGMTLAAGIVQGNLSCAQECSMHTCLTA